MTEKYNRMLEALLLDDKTTRLANDFLEKEDSSFLLPEIESFSEYYIMTTYKITPERKENFRISFDFLTSVLLKHVLKKIEKRISGGKNEKS